MDSNKKRRLLLPVVIKMSIYEDGTMTLLLQNNTQLNFTHVWTPDRGFIFENDTVKCPNGVMMFQRG
jgi:hypothetical protein